MKGYKVFNPDFTCRGFQYEIGNIYEMELSPDVCKRGFHFCKRVIDCFNYYSFDPANKVAEIAALGVVEEEGNKCATNKIQIGREITWAELLDLVNTGKGNTGHSNSGDSNSGHYNSGDYNSRDYNSGDSNSGHYNSGDYNSGDSNSGDSNSGHYNSGHRNSGHNNSGHRNSGHNNSGHYNSGDYNSGDFNATNYASGCFCTEKHKIMFFDQESKMTLEEWRNSAAYQILCCLSFKPTTWVSAGNMNNDEKEAHPEYKVTGGYLKSNNTDQAFSIWWDSLTKKEKEIIKGIPNFNPEKFKQITGIAVFGSCCSTTEIKKAGSHEASDCKNISSTFYQK